MAEPEELEDDLFADLYEGDDVPTQPTEASRAAPEYTAPKEEEFEPVEEPMQDMSHTNGMNGTLMKVEDNDERMQGGWDANQHYDGGPVENDDNYGPVGIKEDGGKTPDGTAVTAVYSWMSTLGEFRKRSSSTERIEIPYISVTESFKQ
ncbi:hypothetical protein BU16DRAFT_378457 [Lophium mytilinum]|uniref:Uncharacterized protein n=1 Tax=Lophium mytilinum TaxID=390894 RepID=A0A6A6QST5_9PEZI|nr:hypothetical protein BU16DRAFT_378457 [Lophium mytilinum]